jgi:PKD repeat protein
VGTPGTTTVTITENDPTPTVQFSSATYSAAENGGSVTITVTKTGTTTQSCSVSYATADGTAIGGVNYTSSSGTLSFAAGDTSKTFTVTVADNNVYDVNRNFNLALSSPIGCTQGALNTAVVTIAENDPAPVVQIASATYGIAENAGKVTIQFSRTGTTPAWPCSVNYATADGTATQPANYTATSGTATFPADNGTYYIDVPQIDNTVYDVARTFTLSISSPSNCTLGATTVTTVTITENDPAPTVQFSSSAYSIAENGLSVAITVTKAGLTNLPCSVQYATSDGNATAGLNYTSASGILDFAAGDTSKTFTVSVADNAMYDLDRYFNVELSTPVGCTSGTPDAATVTITEDDAVPTVQYSADAYSVDEAAGTVTITVTRTGLTARPFSVRYATSDGNATAGTDYGAASGTLDFATGDMSRTFQVPVIDRHIVGTSVCFTVALSDPSTCTAGSRATASVYIQQNDVAPVADFHANVTAGIGILCVGFADDSAGYPAAWSWDFGDVAFGTANSTLENPAHVYTSPGTYTVTLTAINANGTSTLQRTTYITLLPYPPEAGFTADVTHGQVPLTVRFNDTSSNTPDAWQWSFGDGSANETTQNVTHTYTYPGCYNITLTASNPGGSGTVQKTGYITVTPGNQSTNGEDWWYDDGNQTVTPTPAPTATPTPTPNATATPTPTPTAMPTVPASATPVPGFSLWMGLTALVALGAIAGLRREH